MSAMGGKQTLAFRQFGPAPRAESDEDCAAACFIEDDESVAIAALVIVDEAIRTVETVRVHVAGVLDVVAHHFAAMVSHAVISLGRLMSTMGGKQTWRASVRCCLDAARCEAITGQGDAVSAATTFGWTWTKADRRAAQTADRRKRSRASL